jgi:hypothetical protein
VCLYLQPDVELSLHAGNVVLHRRDVPVFHVLGFAEAVALASLGATGEEHSASHVCEELFQDGSKWVRQVINRYWTYLGAGPRAISIRHGFKK